MRQKFSLAGTALFQFVLSFALIILTVLCFLNGFKLTYSTSFIIGVSLPFTAFGYLFISYLDRRKRIRGRNGFIYKAGKISLLLFLIGVIIYTILYFNRIQEGLHLIINEIKRAFTQYYGGIFHGEIITENEGINISYAALLIVFLEIFPVCYVIRSGGVRWIFFAASFIVAVLPFFAGLIPDDEIFLAYILCTFPVFAVSVENRVKERLRTSLRQLVLLVAFFCLFVGVRIFPSKWYAENFDAEKTKRDIQEATYKVESDLFRKLFHSMEDSATYAGGLNKGELGWLDEIRYTNKNALEITMPEQVRDEKAYSLFFRSYVGEDYKSNRFNSMGREQRREKDALDKKYGLDVGELNSLRIPLSGVSNIADKAKISIKNIWAGDDFFAPYACCDEVGFNGDGNIEYENEPEDSDYYEVEFYYAANDVINRLLDAPHDSSIDGLLDFSLRDYNSVSTTVVIGRGETDYGTFSDIENDYRNYVYKYDLRIPNGVCERTVKAFQDLDKQSDRVLSDDGDYGVYRLTNPVSSLLIHDYIKLIKDYLDKNTSYSLAPGHLPEDKDFTEYFLFEGKEGYCTYYAATATIAFRSLGIPARYVEGFKASKQDIDNARNNGDGTITFLLKDVNAHAWVEIYLDGYGWYPVEVTPGYEQSDDADAADGILEHEKPDADVEDEADTETENNEEDFGEDEYDPYAFNSPKPEITEGEAEGAGFIGSLRKDKRTWLYIAAIVLAALLFIGGTVFATAGLRRRRRRQKLSNPVLSKRALYLYHVTENRLRRRVKNSGADSLEEILRETGGSIEVGRSLLTRKAGGRLELGKELGEIQRIGGKAYFSGRDISMEEWEKMKGLCEGVIGKIG